MTVVGVPGGDDAAGGGTSEVGFGAVVMGVLGIKTPAAGLPEGALCLTVVWLVLVALETVGEAGFTSASLPQDDTGLEGVFSRFYIWRALGSKDAGNSSRRWCGRMVVVKMGNEAGTNGSMGEAAVGG
jgi:hypothetical protein